MISCQNLRQKHRGSNYASSVGVSCFSVGVYSKGATEIPLVSKPGFRLMSCFVCLVGDFCLPVIRFYHNMVIIYFLTTTILRNIFGLFFQAPNIGKSKLLKHHQHEPRLYLSMHWLFPHLVCVPIRSMVLWPVLLIDTVTFILSQMYIS